MPAKDIFHDCVKHALIKDGWTITHDPLRIRLARGKNLFEVKTYLLIWEQKDY